MKLAIVPRVRQGVLLVLQGRSGPQTREIDMTEQAVRVFGDRESVQHDGIVTVSTKGHVQSIDLVAVTEQGAVLRLMIFETGQPMAVLFRVVRSASRWPSTVAFADKASAVAFINKPLVKEPYAMGSGLLSNQPTGKLSFSEFQTLANLLRRFEVNHVDGSARSAVEHADEIIRSVYSDLYVPA